MNGGISCAQISTLEAESLYIEGICCAVVKGSVHFCLQGVSSCKLHVVGALVSARLGSIHIISDGFYVAQSIVDISNKRANKLIGT
jgi:hypothetical protein